MTPDTNRKAVRTLDIEKLEKLGPKTGSKKLKELLYAGKVRDSLDLGKHLIIFTTDRISAFDRVLDAIPWKGEILQSLSLFWFRNTEDIIRNHIIREISPHALLVRKCKVVPVEVVVRGYLAGSAYRDYEKGNLISGIKVKAGMKKNEKFASPILTPTTKAEKGMHDEPVSRDEIVRRGIVEESLWSTIEEKALALFERGTKIAAERGLILVDTKYEFGLADDGLYIVDEIHTQDSSRYWHADTYADLFAKGSDQRELDKEHFRKWLMARGYMGDGTPPPITDEVKAEIAEKYMEAFRIITGKTFEPSNMEIDEELSKIAQTIDSLNL
jgi:phosphoribosylaminoimidazole-succinocarboxamide synthase